MSFYSYNVDGISNIINDRKVMEHVMKYSFVGLYETWCENISEIENIMKGYTCFGLPAKRRSKHGRASGGIAVYITDKLLNSIDRLHCEYDLAVIVRLKGEVQGLLCNMIIIFAYIPPFGSVYYEDSEENGMDNLRNEINRLSSLYPSDSILVMGDLNSRIGTKQDYIEDNVENVSSMEWYTVDKFKMQRKSRDKEVNMYGKSLLEMCVENDMHVLNGRCGDDVEGNFTFINQNGCSCIDYVVCSRDLFEHVTQFAVQKCERSCHFPVICTLTFKQNKEKQPITNVRLKKPVKYRWSQEN